MNIRERIEETSKLLHGYPTPYKVDDMWKYLFENQLAIMQALERMERSQFNPIPVCQHEFYYGTCVHCNGKQQP